jgi:hypothetical protein
MRICKQCSQVPIRALSVLAGHPAWLHVSCLVLSSRVITCECTRKAHAACALAQEGVTKPNLAFVITGHVGLTHIQVTSTQQNAGLMTEKQEHDATEYKHKSVASLQSRALRMRQRIAAMAHANTARHQIFNAHPSSLNGQCIGHFGVMT